MSCPGVDVLGTKWTEDDFAVVAFMLLPFVFVAALLALRLYQVRRNTDLEQ
jgi:hypothetical protein